MVSKEEKGIIEISQDSSVKATELITGVLLSDKKNFIQSGGHLVQSALKGDLRRQLYDEIYKLREKGRLSTKADLSEFALADLLSVVDQNEFDKERFEAIKMLFLYSITTGNEKDQELAHQLMQTCKNLDAGEILVLKATYNVFQDRMKKETRQALSTNYDENSRNDWLKIISIEVGHGIAELIENHEDKLIKLRLLNKPIHPDNSGIYPDKYRLTPLAIKLCQFIEQANIQLQ